MREDDPDDLAAAIARVTTTLTFDDLDDATIDRAKQLLTDVIGVTIAGADAEGVGQIRGLALDAGGTPQGTILGFGDRVPAVAAATVNAVMGRALDFDDVTETAMIHPSVGVLAPALACLQQLPRQVAGTELLTALVIGVDVANRLSWAATVSRTGDAGARIVSTNYPAAAFAGTVAASRVLGLTAHQVVHALGIVHGQAAGNQQAMFEEALSVRVQQGLTAGSAVMAAQLAAAGVTGPVRAFEGQAGYYAVSWQGQYDRSQLLDGYGSTFTVDQVSTKPYPGCKHTHPAIGAARELASAHRFEASDIHEVLVEIRSREYFDLVCTPLEPKQRPSNQVEAQFSLPYVVAHALAVGSPDLDAFQAPAFTDHLVLGLAARVVPVLREDDLQPLPAPTTVRVRLMDGRELEATCAVPLGHPSRPMGWDDLQTKFQRAVAFPTRPMPPERVPSVLGELSHVEDIDDVSAWVDQRLRW